MAARDRWEQCARVLALFSAFLNRDAGAVTEDMVETLSRQCGILPEDAYSLLLAGALGLDVADNREDARLYREDFPRILRRLDTRAFMNDPYYRRLRVPDASLGRFQLTRLRLRAYEAFVCGDMRAFPDGARLPQIGYFTEAFEYPALLEDGRIWMTVTPNEVATIAPVAARARGNVLALGLGLGYFAYLAAQREAVSGVTIIEKSEEVIALFEKFLRPRFPNARKLRVVRGDAFALAPELYESGAYDFLFADLWHDAGDGLPMYFSLKEMEKWNPSMEYAYWIEDTMRCYID